MTHISRLHDTSLQHSCYGWL